MTRAPAAALLTALLMIAGGPAARAQEVREELIMSAKGSLSPSDAITWEAPTTIVRTYDATGALIAEQRSVGTDEGVGTLAVGDYQCVADRYPKSLKVYEQMNLKKDTNKVYYLYVFQPYLYNDARRVSGQLQDQLEICGVGGADMKPDQGRLLRTGPSATVMRTATKIIGWSWEVGEDLGNVTAQLGFKVGNQETPVTVTGSVRITVSDSRNEGAQGYAQDVDLLTDDRPNNAVHAWWESACSLWSWCGSHDHEGATVHGLWEFLSGRKGAEDLLVEAYAVWH